jgi:hypothetical protein
MADNSASEATGSLRTFHPLNPSAIAAFCDAAGAIDLGLRIATVRDGTQSGLPVLVLKKAQRYIT